MRPEPLLRLAPRTGRSSRRQGALQQALLVGGLLVAGAFVLAAPLPEGAADSGRFAERLLAWQLLLGVLLATLAAPFLTLDTITRERRDAGLVHLFSGPWSSTEIVASRVARPLLLIFGVVALSTGVQLILSTVLGGTSPKVVLTAHLMTAIVATAFLFLGMLCSIVCRDAITAAGVCLLVGLLALGAPLLATPAIDQMTDARPLIEATLLVDPAIGVATALGLDVMRSERLYRMSPIGQRRFSYPEPGSTILAYLTLTVVLLAGSIYGLDRLRRHHGLARESWR